MQHLQFEFFGNVLRAFVVCCLLLIPLAAHAKPAKQAAYPPSIDAARNLLINTAIIDQVADSAVASQSSFDSNDDGEESDETEEEQQPIILDKREIAAGRRDVKESISTEIMYSRPIAKQMPMDAPEYRRLIEPENWAVVNEKLKNLSRIARKRLPSLTRRMKTGFFATWTRAMLPPIGKGETANTELYDAFIELRRWLDNFDPMLSERQQQEARAIELIDAIHANNRELVEKLVDSGIPITASEFPIAETPVAAALNIESEALLEYLISRNAVTDPLDRLIELEKSASDHPGLFSRLLSGAEFPNQYRINEKIRRITDVLFRKRRTEEMTQWIAAVNDVTRLQNQFGDSYLFEIVEEKDITFLKMFLEAGANPNVDSRHVSLLAVALATRNLDVVKPLIDHGADLKRPYQVGSPRTTFEVFLSNSDFTPEDWPLIQLAAESSKGTFINNKEKAAQIAERVAQQTGLPNEYVFSVLHGEEMELNKLEQRP